MSTPDSWQRIYDHEFAAFGRRVIYFASPLGDYRLEVNDTDQNSLIRRIGDVEDSWAIWLKEIKDGCFRLSGSSWSPDAWFELTLSTPAKIVYWPDENVGQIDIEVVPQT